MSATGSPSVSPLWQRLLHVLPERPRFLLAEPPDETALMALASGARRAQRWMIADPDAARIDVLFERLAAAAQIARLPLSWPARALIIHAPGGAWRIEGVADRPGALMDRSLVDAVIVDRPDDHAELWRVYRHPLGRPPLLACHCATGRVEWLPGHPADALLRPAGPSRRPAAILRDLRDAGCEVASAVSDLRVSPKSLSLLRGLVQEAASATPKSRRDTIDAWETARLRQTLDARLAVRVGYRDILALPHGQQERE